MITFSPGSREVRPELQNHSPVTGDRKDKNYNIAGQAGLNFPVTRDKGLTMLELIIAVMFSAIVAVGAYSFYFAASQSWERSTFYKDGQQNARLAVRAVEQDLRYADWLWIGDNWEDHWRDGNYSEPGVGDVIYYIFYGDKRSGESRPHLIFNKIWLGPERTMYLRRKVLLTELNHVSYVNTTPYYLADNIQELSFSYDGSGKNMLNILVKAGKEPGNSVELQSSLMLRNINTDSDTDTYSD